MIIMNTLKKSGRTSKCDWQAEMDAHTLAEYEEIMGNAKRRNAAIKTAKRQAADLNKRLTALNKIGKNGK